jgi:hypothetical protein
LITLGWALVALLIAASAAAADPPSFDAHADFTGDTASGEGGLWTATTDYEWEQSPPGSAVSYLSEPLGQTRRQRDFRAERLGARRRTQARRRKEHPARAGAEPAGIRSVTASRRPLH